MTPPRYNTMNAFRERLRAEAGEDALAAFELAVKEYVAANPGSHPQNVRFKVAPKFGYIGPKDERKRFDVRYGVASIDAERSDRQSAESDNSLMEAIKGLPATDSPIKEADWVRGHPAMMRGLRGKSGEKILVTAEDVLSAPHGLPPSQAAVFALQTWVAKPEEFQKWYLSNFAKKIQEREEAEAAARTAARVGRSESMAIEEVLKIIGAISEEAEGLAREALLREKPL